MTIIISLIMFMLLILFHELGHFALAKLSGIKVNEFSVGMGPSVKQFKKNETSYSIRLLPLGGYVAMEGEDESSEDPNSYRNAKPYKKFLTILAGPLMNLLIALVIYVIINLSVGVATNVIGDLEDRYPAKQAGIHIGDMIVEVDGVATNNFMDLSTEINNTAGEAFDISVIRDGKKEKITGIQAKKVDDRYVIGIKPEFTKRLGTVIKDAYLMVIFVIKSLWNVLGMLFTGSLGLDAVSGPVGVIGQVGKAASQGIIPLLNFTAFISINLGFFNLLPIPALDGSKLVFIIIEKIIGRPINEKVEQTITIVGFLLLLALIVLVTFKDISRLIFK